MIVTGARCGAAIAARASASELRRDIHPRTSWAVECGVALAGGRFPNRWWPGGERRPARFFGLSQGFYAGDTKELLIQAGPDKGAGCGEGDAGDNGVNSRSRPFVPDR